MMSVSRRSFQRIANSTQSDVVLCDYSLIWFITPVCCSEAVMAAVDGGVDAVCCAGIIVDRFDMYRKYLM